jgi:hypothetical protein
MFSNTITDFENSVLDHHMSQKVITRYFLNEFSLTTYRVMHVELNVAS